MDTGTQSPSTNQPSRLPVFMSPYEAAEYLGCHHFTIRRMINDGRLRAVRVGRLIRIDPEDLRKALKPVGRQTRGGAA